MRIFAFVLLLFPLASFSQIDHYPGRVDIPPIQENGSFFYRDTIHIDTTDAALLYSRARSWASWHYNNADYVLTNEDQVYHKLSGRSFFYHVSDIRYEYFFSLTFNRGEMIYLFDVRTGTPKKNYVNNSGMIRGYANPHLKRFHRTMSGTIESLIMYVKGF